MRIVCTDLSPVLEVGIESFLCFPVLRVEFMEFVITDVERSDIPSGLYDSHVAFLYGMVEQTAAYKVYKPVR